MNKRARICLLIGGPTASGKSALAFAAAQRENGVIINADAMQIYDGLPVLTSQPDAIAITKIPHRLYGFVNPATRFSVGKWLAAARTAIDACLAADKLPIVVGGTGLYFRALLHGLAEIPDIPSQIHDETVALHKKLGGEAFRNQLAKLDKVSAEKLHAGDSLRLVRAYEVAVHTGKPVNEWQQQGNKANPLADMEWQRILVLPPREELYANCDHRFAAMIKAGAIGEVEALLAQELDPELPAMKIIGVGELGDFLANKCDLTTAVQAAQQSTRNYAKRQVTWFKNQWQKENNEVKVIAQAIDNASAEKIFSDAMVNVNKNN
jgi:tRNA dimethylallyltransferase